MYVFPLTGPGSNANKRVISRDAATATAASPTTASETGDDGATGFPSEYASQREYAHGHANK